MKKLFITLWLFVLFSAIAYLFWQNEWKYSLPTPVPINYHQVKTGTFINLSDKIKTENNKPLFLHFFNPSCPCSRFNIPHIKSLVKKYGAQISFAIVVMAKDKSYTVGDIQNKFGLNVPVFFDKSIADSCGVYSTPQAVILDAEHRLYYRGNYNRSRYCTDKNSNFAQMALDSLLNDKLNPLFNPMALKSYGCQLPQCVK